MIINSTSIQNDIIRYSFNEVSSTEIEKIENRISSDQDSLKLYKEILNIRNLMDKIRLYPSDESIEKILNFSKNCQPAI